MSSQEAPKSQMHLRRPYLHIFKNTNFTVAAHLKAVACTNTEVGAQAHLLFACVLTSVTIFN